MSKDELGNRWGAVRGNVGNRDAALVCRFGIHNVESCCQNAYVAQIRQCLNCSPVENNLVGQNGFALLAAFDSLFA